MSDDVGPACSAFGLDARDVAIAFRNEAARVAGLLSDRLERDGAESGQLLPLAELIRQLILAVQACEAYAEIEAEPGRHWGYAGAGPPACRPALAGRARR